MQISGDQVAAIEKVLQSVSQQTYPFFTAVAAVGLLSMAFIQTFKDLFPVRRMFQGSRVARWLQKRGSNLPPVEEGQNLIKRFAFEVALEDLIRLAADGDTKALYDLPLEQLCGQMTVPTATHVSLSARFQKRCLMLQLSGFFIGFVFRLN